MKKVYKVWKNKSAKFSKAFGGSSPKCNGVPLGNPKTLGPSIYLSMIESIFEDLKKKPKW